MIELKLVRMRQNHLVSGNGKNQGREKGGLDALERTTFYDGIIACGDVDKVVGILRTGPLLKMEEDSNSSTTGIATTQEGPRPPA